MHPARALFTILQEHSAWSWFRRLLSSSRTLAFFSPRHIRPWNAVNAQASPASVSAIHRPHEILMRVPAPQLTDSRNQCGDFSVAHNSRLGPEYRAFKLLIV